MMTALAKNHCEACSADAPKLNDEEISRYLSELKGWEKIVVDDEPRLEKVYKTKDFATAMAFANRIGAAAEEEDHHPEVTFGWGFVKVHWWTHKIKGLHTNDFVMAGKTDEMQ